EVDEPQRSAVDRVTPLAVRQHAVMEIPICDVVARIARNRGVDHPRSEIDPSLIHEHASRWIDSAVAFESLGPPGEQLICFRTTAQTEKAEVVRPGQEDVDLA